MPELRERVYTLKSTAEAIRLRNEILFCLERACTCADPESRRTLLCFTVVGGGPTGVEIAGALGEMKSTFCLENIPRSVLAICASLSSKVQTAYYRI